MDLVTHGIPVISRLKREINCVAHYALLESGKKHFPKMFTRPARFFVYETRIVNVSTGTGLRKADLCRWCAVTY